MAFNCYDFWLTFPFIFLLYWIIPHRFNTVRNAYLLIISYLLYLNWNPSFAIVLVGVTLISYAGGYCIECANKYRKFYCWLFVILGLLPLLVFKYYNFINETVTKALASVGLHFSLTGLEWAVPIGISFYTLQAVGYIMDVYHQRIPATRNIFTYALFISFFPQVTSGPISTAKDLMPQFAVPHVFNYEKAKAGLKMFLWGLFLKVYLADRVGMYVDTVFPYYMHFSGAVCLFASFMYSIQIYSDFAGYSLMAIGIAKTLGFDLINNFERPYFAASVTEFWRRWHISLTKWLTTHIYINLGGNRCSKLRQYANILVTFLVSGLWHGANMTFVFWGLLHGLYLVIEKAILGDKLKAEIKNGNKGFSLFKLLRIVITFNLVSFTWIFFRMPTFIDAKLFIKKIFFEFGEFSMKPLTPAIALIIGFGIILLIGYDIVKEYNLRIFRHTLFKWVFYILIACLIFSTGVLDASQFIYVGF